MRGLMKKNAVSNNFEIIPCHAPKNPYTAPPLTRHNGLQTGPSGEVKQEINA
jgi:hypothetical protein